jgi:hypothetical protein
MNCSSTAARFRPAKGFRIGRLKTRDSDLIRKLRASGMICRQLHIVLPPTRPLKTGALEPDLMFKII